MHYIQKYKILDFAPVIVNLYVTEIFKEAKIKLCKIIKKEKQNYYPRKIDALDHKNIFQGVR